MYNPNAYINAHELELAIVEKGQASKRYKLGEIWELNGNELREVMDSLPTVEIREDSWITVARKTGKWVGLEADGYADGNPVYHLWECSRCGNEIRTDEPPNYCDNCGAEMEGEE